MRTLASVTLSVAILVSAACSEPECGDNELKIGKTCFPLKHAVDAGATSAATGQTDATTGQGNVTTGQANTSVDGGGGSVHDGGTAIDGGSSGMQAAVVPVQAPAPAEDAAAAKDPAVPPQDSSRQDAAATVVPAMPVVPTCVPTMEVCDGKDNNCDGAIDETGGAWWSDCDDDGFAASGANEVNTCAKPMPTTHCKSWTSTAPHGLSNVDCDDASPRRYPGASFGLSDGTNADLDCDGMIEIQYEFVASYHSLITSSTPLNVCMTNTQCSCLAAATTYRGYKGIDAATGKVMADFTDAIYDIAKVPPPCAQASTDVIGVVFIYDGPDCRTSASQASGVAGILRKVCK